MSRESQWARSDELAERGVRKRLGPAQMSLAEFQRGQHA